VEYLIKRAARDLVKTNNTVELTGAGISIESGIPPFRGITQNVDGLHQMAGNRDVIEFHGSFARQRQQLHDSRSGRAYFKPYCR